MNPWLLLGLGALAVYVVRRLADAGAVALEQRPLPPGTLPPAGELSPRKVAPAAPYITAAADVLPPSWPSVEPLRDRKTGGYAHLTYRGALAAARANGAELLSGDDVTTLSDAARAIGFELAPVILPDAATLKQAGIAANDTAAINAFRNANMGGEAWARYHDEAVRAQLVARGWDGKTPIANAGKLWTAGAPTGRAYLKGWRVGGKFIQAGPDRDKIGVDKGPHDDGHHDYATLTVLKRSAVA